MKKLLIALTAAASAFGLYADVAIGGAGFDSLDAAPLTWTADGFDADYWSGTEGTMTPTAGDSDKFTKDRPAGYSEDRDGYMAIKTTLGTPVFQNIKAKGLPQDIDPNFFYDGLVQFTAFDETPDMAAYSDAKIGIFPMLENPDSETAYLWVYANGGTNLWKTTKVIDGAWHRVTIKMIKNVTRTAGATDVGFVVFVDGVAVDCIDAKEAFNGLDLNPAAKAYWDDGKLFRSLAPTANEFTGVAYDGQGLLDEVGFTDLAGAPEFALDENWATVSWTSDKIAKVYVTDGESVVAESTTGFVDFVRAAETTYSYYYDAADGYIGIPAEGAIKIEEATTEITDEPAAAAFEIGSTPYATWADAVAAASGDVTITLKGNNYTMTEDDLAALIDNEGGLTTIDFAGSVLTGEVQAATAIKFVDSGTESVGGIVGILNSDEMLEAVYAEGAVYIEGGKFDGLLICDDTPDGITGGMFLEQDAGATEFALAGSVADGYVAELADSYWTVKVDTSFTVTVEAAETGSHIESIVVDGVPVEEPAAGDFKAETSVVVTYAVETGYKFTDPTAAVQTLNEKGSTTAPAVEALPIVAYIAAVPYYTFADAFAAANETAGQTISIVADCSFSTRVTNTVAMTIDVAKDVTLSWDGDKGIYPFFAHADLTLTGTGTIQKTSDSASLFIFGEEDDSFKPTVTINGPTLKTAASNAIKLAGGVLNFVDGKIEGTQRGINVCNAENAEDAVANITGGWISAEDPLINNREGKTGTINIPATSTVRLSTPENDFAPAGYKFLADSENEGWYKLAQAKTINVTAGEGIAAVEAGGVDVTGDVTIQPAQVPFMVTLTAADGIESPIFKIAVNGDDPLVVESTFTFSDYAAIVEGAKVVFTAEAGAAPIIDPTDPESKQTVEAANETEAIEKAEVAVPEAAKGIVEPADYKAYFNFTATPVGDGKSFVVEITGLKAEVVEAPTTADLVANFDKIGEDGGLTVTAQPGLFYGVKQAGAVGGVAEAKVDAADGVATGTTVTLPVQKQGDAGFYKVVVDVKPFN